MSFSKLLDRAKKNQDGFTLIELIVTLAIFSIVLVVAGNYLFFGNNLFVKTEVKNSEKYIGDNVFEYIQRRITYATLLEVINPTSSKEPQYKKVIKLNDEGQLLMGPKGGDITNVFSPEFYDVGYKVNYEVQVLDSMRLELKVNVLAQGNDSPVYTTSEVLKVINLQNSGSILTTDGKQNEIYINPVISYQEDKEISTAYNPIYLKEWMVYSAEQLMDGKTPNGETPEEFKNITGNAYTYLGDTNGMISSYVVQHYYNVEPKLGNSNQSNLYPYWEDFPVQDFPDDVIKRVDAKVLEITKYNGEAGTRKDQTLSNYFKTNEGKLKVRAHIMVDRKTKKTSCFIYVISEAGQPWATRLIYSDADGETGWYYLAALKGREETGDIGQKYSVDQRIWKKEDGISNNKTPVYDEIMNQAENSGKTQEGTWVKVE